MLDFLFRLYCVLDFVGLDRSLGPSDILFFCSIDSVGVIVIVAGVVDFAAALFFRLRKTESASSEISPLLIFDDF